MLITVPGHEVRLEVPDSWLAETAIGSFTSSTRSYEALPDSNWPATVVPFADVVPPIRDAGVECLHRERSITILLAFRDRVPIPPIEVDHPPDLPQGKYRVRDGYHRYYLAAAVGYQMIPVSIRPHFDIRNC